MAKKASKVPPRPAAPPEDIFRFMVEFSPTAQLLVDRAGRIVLLNEKAETLFGYRREELIGEPIEVLLPQRFREAHRGYRDGYSNAPQSRAMGAGRDLFGRRKDGVEVPVEIGLNPVRTPQAVFILAAVVDITERKKSEERFRLAVEAAPNAMIMVGGDGRIVLANLQAEKLFGYSQAELLGNPIEMLVPVAARGRHERYRADYSRAPESRAMGGDRELFGRRKDGSEVAVEIGLNPIKSGEETLVLAAILDITERREMQRRLAQSEALAAVGSMAAILAHEIRNPLGSIVMAARSLDRPDLNAEERATISGVLSDESQRLNRTLQDFLQYARPREPKLAVSDLNALVKETVAALQADAGLAGRVSIELRLDPGLRSFRHDPDQVRQVLWNLILNGIQAVDGEGRLEVSTSVENGSASLRVADSGAGIEPAALAKVFDPFFTTKKKGTGLGLAICRRIVAAHGGSIAADNPSGGGARFTVLLPL